MDLTSLFRLGSSFELSLLLPYSCFTWAVAGRTLVRELAIKQAKSQYEGQESLINDIMTIMSAMRACRTPLGGQSCLSSFAPPITSSADLRP